MTTRLGRIHVRDVDAAQSPGRVPVVLLHGTAGSAESWEAVIPRLASERRTLALDLPGHGRSDAIDVPSSGIPSIAACVAEVLAARGIGRATWIGNSIGGHAALHAAVHQEPSLHGLVLVNATGAHSAAEIDAFLRDPGALRARAGVAHDASLFQTALPLMFSNLQSAEARRFVAQAARLVRGEGSTTRVHAAIQAIVSSRDASLADRLDCVRVPTLVVWGDDDRLLDAANATRLAGIVGARLERIRGSGHMPHIETPQEFHETVSPFLCELDAGDDRHPSPSRG